MGIENERLQERDQGSTLDTRKPTDTLGNNIDRNLGALHGFKGTLIVVEAIKNSLAEPA